MKIEVLTVGNELLLGHSPNANAAELGRVLASVGAEVMRQTTVPDVSDAIRDAVADALDRTGFVVIAGGLGAMRDDQTKRAVSELLNRPLVLDLDVLDVLGDRCRRLGRRRVPALVRTEAEIPAGATVLPNSHGMAPGLWLEDRNGRVVVLLPGVHSELRGVLGEQVLPRWIARHGSGSGVVRSRTVRTTCAVDAAVAEMVGSIEEEIAPLTLAYLPSEEGTDLRVTAWALPSDEADARLARAQRLLEERTSPHAYGGDGADLAAVLIDLLRARHWRLAVVESETGGLLGARLGAVSNASDTYLGGIMAYGDAWKTTALNLSTEILAQRNGVSEPAVRAMVAGMRTHLPYDEDIAVIAMSGPSVIDPAKHLATVWLAASTPLTTRVRKRTFQGTADDIRRRAVQGALDLLRRVTLDPAVDFETPHVTAAHTPSMNAV